MKDTQSRIEFVRTFSTTIISCPNCTRSLRIPDDRHIRFKCPHCSRNMEANMGTLKNVDAPKYNYQATRPVRSVDMSITIANDILISITSIDQSFKSLENHSPFSKEVESITSRIKRDLDGLYKKICKYYDESENEAAKAFRLKFAFPSRFKADVTLEYILTYIYFLVQALQNGFLPLGSFFDVDHQLYAFNLIRVNKDKVMPFVKD